jgi:hypothetical protein
MLGLVFKETLTFSPLLCAATPASQQAAVRIAVPSGGSANFASSGGVDPMLHLGIESASEPLDETRGNLASPTSCAANVRPAVFADVNDAFFENSLSRNLVPKFRIYEDLNIGQHTVLDLEEYVLRIVLSKTC